MTTTYTPLYTTTLGSNQATVTFSSIPSTYTDLVLVVAGRSTYSSTVNYWVQFNGDTTSNYSTTRLQGDGSSATSNRSSNTSVGYAGIVPAADAASGVFSASTLHIMNYANTTTYKTSIARGNTNTYTAAYVMLWRKTPEAINSIVLGCDAGNWVAGSTFSLYGVASTQALATTKATGGDSIVTSGGYTYHVFRNSGTFTPSQSLTCDYLVIAGGGSGGGEPSNRYGGGGGGAGGLRSTVGATGGGGSLESAFSANNGTAYTITIGAGGTGNTGRGTSGSNSSIAGSGLTTITSIGGGAGGSANDVLPDANGLSGGSGGGVGGSGGTYGAGTANQGYRGGNFTYNTGGGGAGGTGGDSAISAGGIGVQISAFATATLTGVSNYYAGGGGAGIDNGTGGAGGAGGGGTGGAVGTSGVTNTGGGGGGSGQDYAGGVNGGNGGSGIVIVRYAI